MPEKGRKPSAPVVPPETLALLSSYDRDIWFQKHPEDGPTISVPDFARMRGVSVARARDEIRRVENNLAALRPGPTSQTNNS